jgi:two-component system, OmpR family, sensor kinase
VTRSHSIYKRLLFGLAGIGSLSSLLLLGAVFIDYHLGYSDLATADAARKAWHEVLEHVVLPTLLFVIPIGLAVIVVVRHALQPLENAATEIEAARGKERGFRLEEQHFPNEAKPFAAALNEMLERIEKTTLQQEAFAADVAHELRTPLTLARLELAQLDGEAKDRLAGDLQSMQRLIDQLLLLAQVKAADATHIPHEEHDLAIIGRECVAALAPTAIFAGKEVAFEDAEGTSLVLGWREAIQSGLRNLIENALRVTPVGGTVRVIAGPGARLRVCDGGPGLTSQQLDNLVQRHARAENASRSGAGLGLAIVDQIMQAHGGVLATFPDKRELCLQFPGNGD